MSRLPFLSMLCVFAWSACDASDDTLRIAATGPGNVAPSIFFERFLAPRINNVSAVLFSARLGGTDITSDTGLYVRTAFPLSLPVSTLSGEVAREDDTLDIGGSSLRAGSLLLTTALLKDIQLPSSPSPIVGYFSDIAFELPVRSGLANGNTAIVRERPATAAVDDAELIAAEGEDVPNGDGRFGDLGGFNLFGFGQNGDVGFFTSLGQTSAGVANDTALYRHGSESGAVEIVREGDVVGGETLNGLFAPQMNTRGAMVFLGALAAAPTTEDFAVFRVAASSGTPVMRVREDDPLPDGDGRFAAFSELRINNAGDLAFAALLRDTDGLPDTQFAGSSSLDDSGLFLARENGQLLTVVREGDLVPTGDVRFAHFADALTGNVPRPAFNDVEQLAFRVELFSADEARPSGIFVASPDEVREIVRSGDAYEEGVLAHIDHPALNNAGMVAFLAELQVGTVQGEEGSSAQLRSVLVVSDGIDSATVVREGAELHGGVVADIIFNNDPSGQVNGLNDDGAVAYHVIYESGQEAINVWSPLLTLRRPLPAPEEPLQWDDAANWRFGLTPRDVHDLSLDADDDTTLHGPATDTRVRSLSLGAGPGEVRLVLGTGSLGTIDGLDVGARGVLEGGGTLDGSIRNEGVIAVAPGLALTATGDIVNLGEVFVAAAANFRVTGRYSGDGLLRGTGLSLFGGDLDPGNSPALLEVEGDVTLEATNTTHLELAGTTRGSGYDSLQIGGRLTLGGTLDVRLVDGFTPSAGASFLLASASVLEGVFATTLLPDIAGLRLLLRQDATSVHLDVQPVPLPPTLGLLLGASAALLARGRRHA